ncbi:MAG: dienelactone hydrolase family protein [Actinobacteria bacterium]|nr:dienelactone hydrolase family protein [Actinomycetota bacterium]
MGEMIEFASNGSTAQGYVAGDGGSGVVVIQEWWGLVPHIKDVCERLASEGFVALAPDLYGGESTTEPDEAGKLMMALNIERAAKDLTGAVDAVQGRASGSGIGVIGFCMGGGLALYLGTLRPDAVKAVAPFYGVIPWQAAQPDYSKLDAVVEGHYADGDDFLPVDQVRVLEEQLRGLGTTADLHVYPNTGHGFFNDTRPDVYNAEAAAQAWDRVIALFRTNVG